MLSLNPLSSIAVNLLLITAAAVFHNEWPELKSGRSAELRIDKNGVTIGRRGLLLAALTLLASSTMLSLAILHKKSSQLMSNFFLFWVTLSAMHLAFAAQNPFDGLDLVSNAPLQ